VQIQSKDFRVHPGEPVTFGSGRPMVKAVLQVEAAVSGASGGTRRGIELAAATSLRVQPVCLAAHFSRHGRGRQGRRHPPCPYRESIRKAVRFPASNSRAPTNWSMTFSGAPRASFPNAARSAYSIALIMKKCWWSGSTPIFCAARGYPKNCATKKPFGKTGIVPLADLESHLFRNGTRIAKIFLHLSKEEQRKRFLARIDEPDKNWKFSLADIHERKYWKQYQKAYEECLGATSSRHAPWYVVPADDKENARLIVSRIVLDALSELKMAYPKTTPKRRRDIGCDPAYVSQVTFEL